jgi:hypothetical protein
VKNPFRSKIGTEQSCAHCVKQARFMLPDRLICGTHAYEYVTSNHPSAGPMPVRVRSQWSKHQKV